MSTLTNALILAAQHHEGQIDKAGQPYILHPLRLMLKANNEETKIVALLHDIVEDTPITLSDLKNEGFSNSIIEAIDCLTRNATETYEQFIERIRENELARHVKILDLEDNSDLSRISQPTEKDLQRMEKYKKALAVLREKGESPHG